MKILIAVLITFFASLELQAQNLIQIVPAPQEVTFKEGSFDLRGDVSVVFSLNDNKEEIFQFEQLKEEAALYRELSLEFSSDMEKRIVVGVYGIDSSFDRLARQHGSAPDIAGKGIANPVASIWTAVMMIDFLGEKKAASLMMKAIERVLAKGEIKTADLGGNSSTREVTDAIISELG